MNIKTLFSVLLLILVIWSGIIYLLSQPIVKDNAIRILPMELAFIKPLWKAKYSQRMVNILSPNGDGYIPQCYECEFNECKVKFISALSHCISQFDDKIPLIFYDESHSKRLGEQIGDCSEKKFATYFNSSFNSKGCIKAKDKLGLSSKSKKISFKGFLKLYPYLSGVIEIDADSTINVRQIYEAFLEKDIALMVELEQRLLAPYMKKAALVAANKSLFIEYLYIYSNTFTEQQCGNLFNLYKSVVEDDKPATQDTIKNFINTSPKDSTKKFSILKHNLLMSAQSVMPNPFTQSMLNVQADEIIYRVIPAKYLIGLEDEMNDADDLNEEKVSSICNFMKGLIENIEKFTEPEKEVLGRFFLYSRYD
jgi:hypothetical protein